jgi:hypothetical protein
MAAKAEAEKVVDEHQKAIDELVTKIEAKRAEIDKLNSETLPLQELLVGPSTVGLDELVTKAGKEILEKFDDPVMAKISLGGDQTVGAKRAEVEQGLKNIAVALQQMEAINKAVSAGLNTAKEAAAKATEQATTEANAKAKQHEEASQAAAVFKKDAPAAGEQSAVVQATGSRARGSGPRSFRNVLLADATAIPIRDRDEDELLVTAKAGKARKAELAAMDLSLANV